MATRAFDARAFGENLFARRRIATEQNFTITGEFIVFGKFGLVIIERRLDNGVGAGLGGFDEVELQLGRDFSGGQLFEKALKNGIGGGVLQFAEDLQGCLAQAQIFFGVKQIIEQRGRVGDVNNSHETDGFVAQFWAGIAERELDGMLEVRVFQVGERL